MWGMVLAGALLAASGSAYGEEPPGLLESLLGAEPVRTFVSENPEYISYYNPEQKSYTFADPSGKLTVWHNNNHKITKKFYECYGAVIFAEYHTEITKGIREAITKGCPVPPGPHPLTDYLPTDVMNTRIVKAFADVHPYHDIDISFERSNGEYGVHLDKVQMEADGVELEVWYSDDLGFVAKEYLCYNGDIEMVFYKKLVKNIKNGCAIPGDLRANPVEVYMYELPAPDALAYQIEGLESVRAFAEAQDVYWMEMLPTEGGQQKNDWDVLTQRNVDGYVWHMDGHGVNLQVNYDLGTGERTVAYTCKYGGESFTFTEGILEVIAGECSDYTYRADPEQERWIEIDLDRVVRAEAVSEMTRVDLPNPAISHNSDSEPVLTNDAPAEFPLGKTVVTWKAEDGHGTVKTASQFVLVRDTTAPDVELAGKKYLIHRLGEPYEDLGVTCTDAYDGRWQATSYGTVDVDELGTQFITYDCIDSAGNETGAYRVISVRP